ncbi:MAG: hypothetical protein Q8Q26_16930 [Pseudorhodobacter sp.]|nr:hypothetical protein [Pseudorhodobacter sp.]
MEVTFEGYAPADGLVESMDPVWKKVDMNYQFTCGGCHVLHAPKDFLPSEWPLQMQAMQIETNQSPEDALIMLKYLQHASSVSQKK